MKFYDMLDVKFGQFTESHNLTRQQILSDLIVDFTQVDSLNGKLKVGISVRTSEVDVACGAFTKEFVLIDVDVLVDLEDTTHRYYQFVPLEFDNINQVLSLRSSSLIFY